MLVVRGGAAPGKEASARPFTRQTSGGLGRCTPLRGALPFRIPWFGDHRNAIGWLEANSPLRVERPNGSAGRSGFLL